MMNIKNKCKLEKNMLINAYDSFYVQKTKVITNSYSGSNYIKKSGMKNIKCKFFAYT